MAEGLVSGEQANVIITGGPAEADLASEIAGMANVRTMNLAGAAGGLGLLKSLVKQADLMVTVDSGTRHFAVALGVPTVVLMGPTHPGYTETPFERGEIIRCEVACGPCQQKQCQQDHRCMELITVDRVLDSCRRMRRNRP